MEVGVQFGVRHDVDVPVDITNEYKLGIARVQTESEAAASGCVVVGSVTAAGSSIEALWCVTYSTPVQTCQEPKGLSICIAWIVRPLCRYQ